MKDRRIITMKPLAFRGSEVENRENQDNMKKFHLLGILNPDENPRQCNAWAVIIASKEFARGMAALKTEANQEECQHFSSDERRELLNLLYSQKIAVSREYFSSGKYLMYDWSEMPLKWNSIKAKYCEKHEESLKSHNYKFLTDELDDYCMFLLPVETPENGVTMINASMHLVGNVTSGPPTRRDIDGRIMSNRENRGWKADNFPLPIGSFVTREQWRALMGCVATLQEHLFGIRNGGNRRSGSWIKSKKAASSNQKSGFLKWITMRSKKEGRGEGKRSRAHGSDDDEENEDVEDDIYEEQERRLIMGEKEKLCLKKKMRKSSQNSGKVKRFINFPEGRNDKGKARNGNNDAGNKKVKPLIRIELKPDPLIQESSFQFCSGDLLRLKVTMYEAETKKEEASHQLEIDFVQNFMCETDTLNACRCRRITKLLKRTTVTDLKWEKGVHISGQQFALCWISYLIPGLVEEADNKEEEETTKDFSVDMLDNKFKVTGFQYELQIRFYKKDSEQSHHALAACFCFPLNIMMTMINAESKLTSILNGDILQIVQNEEHAEQKEEQKAAYDNLMIKSLSATEFDV